MGIWLLMARGEVLSALMTADCEEGALLWEIDSRGTRPVAA